VACEARGAYQGVGKHRAHIKEAANTGIKLLRKRRAHIMYQGKRWRGIKLAEKCRLHIMLLGKRRRDIKLWEAVDLYQVGGKAPPSSEASSPAWVYVEVLGERRAHIKVLGICLAHIKVSSKRRAHIKVLGKCRAHLRLPAKRRAHTMWLGKCWRGMKFLED
jgi:hypothetical protein